MSQSPLISIVVPVYKVEYWLPKCIKSLLAQTYKNIEIILVDDGSPDKSGKICDAFAKKDKRIKVIHKENGGVSSARNAGIDAVSGEYICFVDSDDWLPKKSIETMSEELYKNGVQIVIGNMTMLGKRNTLLKCVQSGKKICFDSKNRLFTGLYEETYFGGVIGKLLSAEIIKNNGIKFTQGMKFGEDVLFLLECFKYCNAVSLIEKPIYYYNRLVLDSAILRHYPELTEWMLTLTKSRQELANQKGEGFQNRELYVAKTALIDFEYIINSTCLQKLDEKDAIRLFGEAYKAFKPYFYPDFLNEGTVEYRIYKETVQRYCETGDFVGLYKKASQKYTLPKNTLKRRLKNRAVSVYLKAKRTVYRYVFK